MNPWWLAIIVPASAFLGAMLAAAVGARATDDFHAAIARRDKEIDDLRGIVHLLGGDGREEDLIAIWRA